MKNGIAHVEWSSTDLDRTKAFLSKLFGWEFKPWSEGYLTFSSPDGISGGIRWVPSVQVGNSPIVYIEVDEIDSYFEQAIKLGGKSVAKTQIPGLGWIAYIADPDRNLVGLVQKT
jgi:predicted enzyme related to lactoylglutathione lyase